MGTEDIFAEVKTFRRILREMFAALSSGKGVVKTAISAITKYKTKAARLKFGETKTVLKNYSAPTSRARRRRRG